MEEDNNFQEHKSIPKDIKSWHDSRTIQQKNTIDNTNNNTDNSNTKYIETEEEVSIRDISKQILKLLLLIIGTGMLSIVYLFIIVMFLDEQTEISQNHFIISYILSWSTILLIISNIKKKKRKNKMKGVK